MIGKKFSGTNFIVHTLGNSVTTKQLQIFFINPTRKKIKDLHIFSLMKKDQKATILVKNFNAGKFFEKI